MERQVADPIGDGRLRVRSPVPHPSAYPVLWQTETLVTDAASAAEPTTASLEIVGLKKRFGETLALRGVDVTVMPGEVHGLLGENGSGKSTVIKVLAGYHVPDAGQLLVAGENVALPLQPGQAHSLGLAFVHQDLGLIPSLSVLENLRLGESESGASRVHISWRRERERAREALQQIPTPDRPASNGSRPRSRRSGTSSNRASHQGVQSRTRGPGRPQCVLVLDEPTVFLPRAGIEQLFALVRQITGAGGSVLFVSHDLDEVREITDRITVLRDGRGSWDRHDSDLDRLRDRRDDSRKELLREALTHRAAPNEVEPLGEVDELSGGLLLNVSFHFSRGEVLGLTGLGGSGFEEVPYFIFGARQADHGVLRLGATSFDLESFTPTSALRAGLSLIPADRQRAGAVGGLSVTENVLMSAVGEFFDGGVLRRRAMVEETHRLMKQFDVRPLAPRGLYASLSGGNQQRALLAKWLRTSPRLLLMHEPTQGVDVGARQQIFYAIREAARDGASVICASSDYEQLAAICDRALIFSHGRVVNELVGADVTQHKLISACYDSAASAPTAAGGR